MGIGSWISRKLFTQKRHIAVIGLGGSGKTVLINSIIWDICSDRQSTLCPGIREFAISPETQKRFSEYRKTMLDNHWPEKTNDNHQLLTQFTFTDTRSVRFNVTIMDIPGERLADLMLWACDTYEEWSQEMFAEWSQSLAAKAAMAAFTEVERDFGSDIELLARTYKSGMLARLRNDYCPITPSTYFIDTEGNGMSEDNDEETLLRRPIWMGGDLIPLHPDWRKKNGRLYGTMRDTYARYRKEVLGPLFKGLFESDGLVICVDILDILASGKEKYFHTEREIAQVIALMRQRSWLARHLKMFMKTRRLAIVSTKRDQYHLDDLENVESLFDKLSRVFVKEEKFTVGKFTCSACASVKNPPRQDIPASWSEAWEKGRRFRILDPADIRPDIRDDMPRCIHLNALFQYLMKP